MFFIILQNILLIIYAYFAFLFKNAQDAKNNQNNNTHLIILNND